MPALAAVIADLLAHPRPLLCLDTCDVLDVIQCVAEGKARRLEHVRRLFDTLTLHPDRAQLVVAYLVPIEWAQNRANVIEEVEGDLDKAIRILKASEKLCKKHGLDFSEEDTLREYREEKRSLREGNGPVPPGTGQGRG
jgi:hypothetical protein